MRKSKEGLEKTRESKWKNQKDPTINPTMNTMEVAVADPVVASFPQIHSHHSFTIIIEIGCYTLIAPN
jgi:hypothetical protein